MVISRGLYSRWVNGGEVRCSATRHRLWGDGKPWIADATCVHPTRASLDFSRLVIDEKLWATGVGAIGVRQQASREANLSVVGVRGTRWSRVALQRCKRAKALPRYEATAPTLLRTHNWRPNDWAPSDPRLTIAPNSTERTIQSCCQPWSFAASVRPCGFAAIPSESQQPTIELSAPFPASPQKQRRRRIPSRRSATRRRRSDLSSASAGASSRSDLMAASASSHQSPRRASPSEASAARMTGAAPSVTLSSSATSSRSTAARPVAASPAAKAMRAFSS